MAKQRNLRLLLGGLMAALLAPPGIAQCDSWNPVIPGLNSAPGGLVVFQNQLYVGGGFNNEPTQHPDWIARWHEASTTWHPVGSGVNDSVSDVEVYMGELIAAGWFYIAGGQTVNGIAAWNGKSWRSLGGGMSSPVDSLVVFDGELIASGSFTSAGGTEVDGIARWNGSMWQPMGSVPCCKTLVAFVEYKGHLYAGGLFDIWHWNGTDWESIANVSGGSVRVLGVYNGELIAGGRFTSIDGVALNRIGRWNGSQWLPLGSGIIGEFPNVLSLFTYNGDLLVGGFFSGAGGLPANGLARWDGIKWNTFPSQLDHKDGSPSASRMTLFQNELFVTGHFDSAGGQPAQNVARWRDCPVCPADISQDQQVNVDDLLAVINTWGACPKPCPPSCDADIAPPTGGDCVVNVDDLLAVINSWGPCK